MQVYTLWACSLLVIPPAPGGMPPQQGFPLDLSELRLSRWADLVQDTAKGLQALPLRLAHDLATELVALLQLLKVATGVGFCHQCCRPRPRSCMGPSPSWSQMIQQAPTYETTPPSVSTMDMVTPAGGLPGYGVPPGLTLMGYQLPVGWASTQMRQTMIERHTQTPMAMMPWLPPPPSSEGSITFDTPMDKLAATGG